MTAGLHPVSLVRERVVTFFTERGFTILEGPEVESAFYNFDLLNIPANHPAREAWDTFVIERGPAHLDGLGGEVVMRTHTTAMQGRVLRVMKPPLRVIVPGRVFRNEATDASHLAELFQLDGFLVEKNLSLAQLKELLAALFRRLVPRGEVTFIQHHYDFVEPGMDVRLSLGGRVLEVAGSGVMHPRVLENCGIDPKVFTGLAFGLGLDRLAMILLELPDIRQLYSMDLRFLKQFRHS